MRFSIITINYNNRAGLQKTIDSVLCQTWKEYEWIVIDGGSTDGSKELIEQYQACFTFWCSEPDKGIYNAMNKGVSHACGEYLNFLNSGDAYYDANVLQKINDLHSDADIISGQIVNMNNNELLHRFKGSLFMQLYETTISHQGAFIKKTLLDKYPYDENLRIISDWKFWLQTIIWGEARIEITKNIVARYDGTGISSDRDPQNLSLNILEREKVKNAFFPTLLRNELAEYKRIKQSPFVVYGDYLKENNHFLFSVGWRIIRLFAVLHQKFVPH